MFQIVKIILSVSVITFVSHLSGKKTHLAGFLTALPLTSMLALSMSYIEWKNEDQTVEYARSIFMALPMSLLFFVPFLVQKQLHLNFWLTYGLGILFLGIGYIIHSAIK